MPQPTRGDVHVSRPLTNISVAYLQEQDAFIADRAFPNIPVSKQSDQYYVYDREDFFRDEFQQRAPGTESSGGGYDLSTSTYSAKVWAHHKDIPDQVRANSDEALDDDRDATEFLSQRAMIRRERNFASNYMSTGVWDTDITGVSNSAGTSTEAQQWDESNSVPITDINNGIVTVLGNTGFRPNKLILGYDVFIALTEHSDIIDRIKYGQSSGNVAMAQQNTIAQLFGLDEVLVMSSVYNSANEGATESTDFVVGKDALLLHAPRSPGLMKPSAGYTFSWRGYLGATDRGMRVKRFRLERESSDRIEMEMAFDQKVVASALGYFFNGIVA